MRKIRKGALLLAAALTFNVFSSIPVRAANSTIDEFLAAYNNCMSTDDVVDAETHEEFMTQYLDVTALYNTLSASDKTDSRVTTAMATFNGKYANILLDTDTAKAARTDNYKVSTVTFQFDNTVDALTTTNAAGKVEIFNGEIVEFADQYKKSVDMSAAPVSIPFKHVKDKFGYEYPTFTDVWDTLKMEKFYADNGLTGATDPKLDPNDPAYDNTLIKPTTIGKPLTGWQLDRVEINGHEYAVNDTFILPDLADCTPAGADGLNLVYYYVPSYSYTLTFDLAGGTTTNNSYKTQTKSSIKDSENWEVVIEKNPDGTFKNAPVKANSTFLGFRLNTDTTVKSDTFTIPMRAGAGNTYKLTAEWKNDTPAITTWTATLDLDGNIPGEAHVTSMDREVDDANDSYIFTLPKCVWTYADHEFQGWATSATATAPDYTAGDTVTVTKVNPAVKLYAIWKDTGTTADTWSPSITYNINVQGSTVAPKTVTLPAVNTPTTTVKIEANSFTNDGYNFKSWNSQADGKGTTYAVGNDVQISKDQPRLVLYAQWEKKPEEWTATIKYTLNGGSGSITDDTTKETASTHEFTVKKPEGISKDGYQFTGWNTKSDGTGTTYAAESKIVVTKENPSNELFAQWKEVKKWSATIKYNANGGSGSIAEQKEDVVDAEKKSLTIKGIEGITNSGYTFSHWNTKADDTGTKYSSNTQWEATQNAPTLELYAIWKKVDPWKATVKYDLNGGTGSISDTTAEVAATDKQNVTLAKSEGISREGYTFKEWNTKADATGTAYKAQDTFTVTMSQPTVTLYAIWVDANGKVATSNVNQSGGTSNKVDGDLNQVAVPKTADESDILWHAIFILLGLAGVACLTGFELLVPTKKRE